MSNKKFNSKENDSKTSSNTSKSSKNWKNKNKNRGNNKSSNNSNSGRLPADSLNSRKDQLDRMNKDNGKEKYANDPLWYYGDAVIADEISRFSFNQFVGIPNKFISYYNAAGGQWSAPRAEMPFVMVLPTNPCPGVTEINNGSYVPASGRGINLALQQWWSLLTAKSGRGATWSKNDLGALLLEIGELISISEHLRRFFGIAFNYSLRNRTLPEYLIRSMGLDAGDFFANLADYRLRFNTTIMRMNKIPIPGNINYFKKCQDLYQKVYVDSASAMAQYYVQVPATTWIIDEGAYSGGTVLHTTPMFYDIKDRTLAANEYLVKEKPRTFDWYLNVLNRMIDSVMLSSTFSLIYSDMLNAAALGTINLWSFDLVAEDYGREGMFEYNEYALLMFHNAMPAGDFAQADFDRYSATSPLSKGTFLNDAVLDATMDIVVYNPIFKGKSIPVKAEPTPLIADFLDAETDIGKRIEANVYKIGTFGDIIDQFTISSGVTGFRNYDLPDHYIVEALVYDYKCLQTYCINDMWLSEIGSTTDYDNECYAPSQVRNKAFTYTKFDWAPLQFTMYGNDSTSGLSTPCSPLGDLNYWTLLSNEWYRNVNDAKQFGLFQIS